MLRVQHTIQNSIFVPHNRYLQNPARICICEIFAKAIRWIKDLFHNFCCAPKPIASSIAVRPAIVEHRAAPVQRDAIAVMNREQVGEALDNLPRRNLPPHERDAIDILNLFQVREALDNFERELGEDRAAVERIRGQGPDAAYHQQRIENADLRRAALAARFARLLALAVPEDVLQRYQAMDLPHVNDEITRLDHETAVLAEQLVGLEGQARQALQDALDRGYGELQVFFQRQGEQLVGLEGQARQALQDALDRGYAGLQVLFQRQADLIGELARDDESIDEAEEPEIPQEPLNPREERCIQVMDRHEVRKRLEGFEGWLEDSLQRVEELNARQPPGQLDLAIMAIYRRNLQIAVARRKALEERLQQLLDWRVEADVRQRLNGLDLEEMQVEMERMNRETNDARERLMGELEAGRRIELQHDLDQGYAELHILRQRQELLNQV